jgi:hypothetical protein
MQLEDSFGHINPEYGNFMVDPFLSRVMIDLFCPIMRQSDERTVHSINAGQSLKETERLGPLPDPVSEFAWS